MTINSPQELLVYELETIEDAEKQASQALPKLNKESENAQLRNLVERRLKQGERILQDVQKGLEKLNGKGRGTQNAAARGLIQETERLLKEVKSPEMKQAVMIAGLQKLEHYCIAAWGTVKAMAQQSGVNDLAQAMERAVREGYEWDQKMTELAEGKVNPEALQKGQ
jgi:ferritin-like metal-binding protein YciE